MRKLVLILVFLAGLSAPARAVTFNCATVMLIHAGFAQPVFDAHPIQPVSFETALAVAIGAMEKASPQAAAAFQVRAFEILEGVEIATTHDGFFEKPYRFVFPNRQPYAAVPRVKFWKAPLLVWPVQRNSAEAALAAVRLVYEVAALKKLPPNTVRFWRHFNGSQNAFIDNAVASLNSQYLLYLGLLQMHTELTLPRRLTFASRWSSLFRGRATRNPYYRGLELTQDLALELDGSRASSHPAEHIVDSLRYHVKSHYRWLLRLDQSVSATMSASVLAGVAYGGMLIWELPIRENLPDSVEVKIEVHYSDEQNPTP